MKIFNTLRFSVKIKARLEIQAAKNFVLLKIIKVFQMLYKRLDIFCKTVLKNVE